MIPDFAIEGEAREGASFPLRSQWVCTSKEFASSGVMGKGLN